MPAARPPGRLAVRILRAPVLLYERGWGGLLGHRFLALTHRGRKSGRRYVIVLEVVEWRPNATEAVLAAYVRRNRIVATLPFVALAPDPGSP